jgi:hypothetical protein
MHVAMYIVGQERRLVNPPSQVVAGVRTVTTNMNGRDVLPRLSRPFAFLKALPNELPKKICVLECTLQVARWSTYDDQKR